MKAHLVWSPDYDLTLYGFERLHPFDGRKFSRAWGLLDQARAATRLMSPGGPADDTQLLRVHTPGHLDGLRDSATVAAALELPLAKLLPNALLQAKLLTPMRLAVSGTVRAAGLALSEGLAMNLGGGYHHAFADHGEGFCLFADVAIAIAAQREQGALDVSAPVAVIDLDAHRGNGFEAIVRSDPSVHVLDIYNFQIYPGLVEDEDARFPNLVPLRAGTGSEEYLTIVREELERFLGATPTPALAFYNAGTDIVRGDPLGRLDVSPEAVVQRDRLVVDALTSRGIPTVVVTSGGYSDESHRLVAALATDLITRF